MWTFLPDNGRLIQIIAVYKESTIGPVNINYNNAFPIICKPEDKLWG